MAPDLSRAFIKVLRLTRTGSHPLTHYIEQFLDLSKPTISSMNTHHGIVLLDGIPNSRLASMDVFDAKEPNTPMKEVPIEGTPAEVCIDKEGFQGGVIRNVLHGQRYKVYIKGTNDELLFQHSDLRPRQDWIDGTWFIASQDQKLYGTIVIVVVLNGYILLGYESRTFRNGSLSSDIKIKMEQLTPTIAMTMAGYVNVAEQIWGHLRDEIKTNENLTVSMLAKRGKEFADHKIKDKTSAGCYIAGFEEQSSEGQRVVKMVDSVVVPLQQHYSDNSIILQDALECISALKAEGLIPSASMFCVLANAYAQQGLCHQTVKVLQLMEAEGIEPNVIMLNVLINAFGVAGRYLEASSIYHHIKESGFSLDVVTYSTLMKAFIRARKFDKVPEIYKEMERAGCTPDRKARQMLQVALMLGMDTAYDPFSSPTRCTTDNLKGSYGKQEYSEIMKPASGLAVGTWTTPGLATRRHSLQT
ncbi:hypothetical protein C1H46_028553 [Malus baccata]|uniref:Uncharacterized protein n=1 Tax=Malus baccata TaxID=106549 RepID=A0A540LHA7_MALBA|nr:hypothetical protein C1H46_028553 [Malus baccata]